MVVAPIQGIRQLVDLIPCSCIVWRRFGPALVNQLGNPLHSVRAGVTVTLTSMSPASKDLLHLESNQGTSSLEKNLFICKNASSDGVNSLSSCHGSLRTTAVPESQVLGKIKDFLQVMGEANHKLQKDIQDKGIKDYDIEVLKGEEEQYIEMDLALGVAELHTAEALAAAESAMAARDQTLPISATSNDSDSSSEGCDYSDSSFKTEDDGNGDNDESDDDNARHSANKSQKSKKRRFTIKRKGLKRPKIEVLQ